MDQGNQPVTQITRDQMAQSDHDKLVEVAVLLRTLSEGQVRLEAQIKDSLNGQGAAIAALEAKLQTIHDAQDARIRKLEDYATQYVPMASIFNERIKKNEVDIQTLKDSRNEAVAGWRVIVWIGGAMAGFVSLLWIVAQLLFHLKM